MNDFEDNGRVLEGTLVLLLACNEAACIAETIKELRSKLHDVEVLVVDDGSSDATSARALEAGAWVVRHPINLGVAAGESTGLKYALRGRHSYVIRMDGDGQHDPASVPAIIAELERGADLVIGGRYSGVSSYQSHGLRRLGGVFLSALIRALSGLTVRDPTSGFRGFSRRAVEYFADTHPHDYPEPESVVMAVRRGLIVAEVPARMRPRATGRSSITAWKSVFYMFKVSFALVLERARPR